MLRMKKPIMAVTYVMASTTAIRSARAFLAPARSTFRSTRAVHLPASVSGTSYSSDDPAAPTVKLFTRAGCTLCDKVKDVLLEVKDQHPHTLEQVDITDKDNEGWFSKYKYDIPVLHMNDQYWTKHRLGVDEAKASLEEATKGSFAPRQGDPDAGKMEHG